jgi:hypothetical protein
LNSKKGKSIIRKRYGIFYGNFINFHSVFAMKSKSRHIRNLDHLETYISQCEAKLIGKGKFKLPIYYTINGPSADGEPRTVDSTIGIWTGDREGFFRTAKSLWEKDNSQFTSADVGVIDGLNLRKMKYYLEESIDKDAWKKHKERVAEIRERDGLQGGSEYDSSKYTLDEFQSDEENEGIQWWCVICQHNKKACGDHRLKPNK